MTSYFQYNDNKTKKPPKRTEHGTEIVEIDSYLVTEELGEQEDGSVIMELSPAIEAKVARAMRRRRRDEPTNDRHGWHCPCSACRADRGEETL